MSSEHSPVLLEREGAVAIIRFNRPAVMNAINEELSQGFLRACRSIANSDARAVVMLGEGKAFMAGGDLAQLRANIEAAPATTNAMIRPLHEALLLLASMTQPVLASVHGAVAGAGLGVMLASDFAIAAEGTRFSVAYLKIALCSDAAVSWFLPRMVGQRKAMELAFIADSIDAQEAERLHLVTRVVPAAELAQETMALAHRLASGPSLAYGRMKALLRGAFERSMVEQMEMEREGVAACAATHDFEEGVRAFAEKRKPRFTGQ